MLINKYMPRWEKREFHRIRVRASAAEVFASLRTADLCGHPIARLLLMLRTLPAALIGRYRWRDFREQALRPITLSVFEEQGFRILAEDPPSEVLLGLEGAFWRPGGDLQPVTGDSFKRPVRLGMARAAWNFSIVPDGPESCILSTETRVLSGGRRARRRFRIYWLLIRPYSGLIRWLMLRAVRKAAEGRRGRHVEEV